MNRQTHNKLVIPDLKLNFQSTGPNKMAVKIYNKIPDDLKHNFDIKYENMS